MSTIASPRASSSIRSPSSTRTSFDASARAAAPSARRNRTALRDYYGIKPASVKETDAKISHDTTQSHLDPEDDETLTELDAADFDADAYVTNLLATEGMKAVLRVEADLVSQIRNLDSDRKSLVYDNYSKLLSATSTIRRMRGNMDPLAPTTHTLGPAIAHIAEIAASLSSTREVVPAKPQGLGLLIGDNTTGAASPGTKTSMDSAKERQRNTIRWVLSTPRRLQYLIDQEREEEAEQDWGQVRRILDKWEGTAGVRELKEECEEIMRVQDDTD
ncbi:unnamed protein product [Periconia digitata]|uniref:Vacuolar protein sorting-associated protein 51 homolog n=1 Tax=Periconia digitata TaxID=1303443 RepID=A0A9W4UN70_9PLEO|nr:unnamed protein product [Periconia digitata]